jgi:hypothetical protein
MTSEPNLTGDWTPLGWNGPALHIRRTDDPAWLDTSLGLFGRHPLWTGVWRAPGVFRSAAWHANRIWVKADGTPWQPYARPGLDELARPGAPPETRITEDALQAMLATRDDVTNIHLSRDGEDAIVTIWLGARQVMLTMRAGVVDVSESE